MPHVSPRFRSFSSLSLLRVLALAPLATLIPAGTAFGQSLPIVKVAREEIAITSRQHAEGDLLMIASRGTALEVIHTEGDRYGHREQNWYWVVLPRDAWGVRHAGWVSGRDVDYVPVEEKKSAGAGDRDFGLASSLTPLPPSMPPSSAETASPAPIVPAAPAEAPVSDVVLNFEFGKSDLTIEAKGKLAAAAAMLKATDQGASFALEGHADYIGSEKYNDELGRKRAEAVRRHLVEEHRVPAEKVGVISYGETKPAASNATSEGRAQNRRVVVKLGE